tara:strand:+ start:59 stop:655 length:597 start_codon:yes stop_codon:yes gene_type:complete
MQWARTAHTPQWARRYIFSPAAIDRRDLGGELLGADETSITVRRRGGGVVAERREVRWPGGRMPAELLCGGGEGGGGVIVDVKHRAVALADGRVLANPPPGGGGGGGGGDGGDGGDGGGPRCARLQLGRVPGPSKAEAPLLHETPFAHGHEVTATLRLPRPASGAHLVLMPATFGAGQSGPFDLLVHADCPFELIELL